MKLHTATHTIVAALLIATCQFAHAHAYPVHQMPGAGSMVSASQKDVAIDYDDGLEPAFSSIKVTDARGDSVTSAKSVVDATNKKHMSVALNLHARGLYTVYWIAVAADGHRTQGRYTFKVE